MRRVLIAVVVSLVFLTSVSFYLVQRGSVTDPAERELIELVSRYRDARRESKPDEPYLIELLDYEERYRGQEIALNALYHLFLKTCNFVAPDSRTIRLRYRAEAARRLPTYAASPLLPRTIKQASNSWYQPEVSAALDDLANEDLPRPTQIALRYYVAIDATAAYEDLRNVNHTKAQLSESSEPVDPDAARWNAMCAELLPEESVNRRYEKAIEVLSELATLLDSPRLSKLDTVEKTLFRPTEDPNQPLYSEQAAARLFRERHLTWGSPAPDLSVSLIDGTKWRLADHRGKVVVIQFSFTGCGPCAEMYPQLDAIASEFGPQIEILTLMRDETPEAAQKKVRSGDLAWSVAHDGKPGRVTSEWSVKHFPTVYLVGPDGRIAKPQGATFREVIQNLLNNEETAAAASTTSEENQI